MTTYTATTSVPHDITDTFGFIADPTNLPHYFPRVTAAELVEPELVRTTAVVDEDGDGNDEPVTSDAWFRADDDAHSISWGSPGQSDYRGSLALVQQDGGTRVDLSVTTVNDHPGVQESLDEALAAIARRLEARSSSDATS